MSAASTLSPQPVSAEPKVAALVLDLVDVKGTKLEWAPSSSISVPRSAGADAKGKPLLQAAVFSKGAEERAAGIEAYVALAQESGLLAFAVDTELVENLNKGFASNGKKDAGIRTGACNLFSAILDACGQAAVITLFPAFQGLLDLTGDKSKKLREEATVVATKFVSMVDKNSSLKMCRILFTKSTHLAQANQTRLTLLNDWVQNKASRQMQFVLTEALPAVANDVHDADATTQQLARDALKWLLATCQNPDVSPLCPELIKGLENLNKIDLTVDRLAGTTFIQNVDTPTLAVMTPILLAGLAQKNTPVTKRACARIIENMAKLVEEPRDLARFLPVLMPLMEKARDFVADPEVRQRCDEAIKTFIKKADVSRSHTNEVDTAVTMQLLQTAFAKFTKAIAKTDAPIVEAIQKHVAEMLVTLNDTENFDDAEWQASVRPYIALLMNDADATRMTDILRTTAMNIREKKAEEEEVTDAEELCRCDFSLAYGNKVLLKKTRLVLHRGFKYGLMGGNDCGKTSLMKAIANQQIDGLPPPEELRTVFVETDIQGEMSHLTVIDYIFADKLLKDCGVSREDMITTLQNIGFNDNSPANVTTMVGNLSGGWKMKLALARAILLKADVLLLDEPTNHMDVHNVKWIQDFLLSSTSMTVIVVTHDAKLLDAVCDHIIHFEDHRLQTFTGNLTKFVAKYPEAKSYFELVSTKMSFKFPPPGKIPGINSKGKALMKMTDITFTYPGAPGPQLKKVSVQVCLASRVGIIGVNGAGKSTMIKLLTGELEADKGSGDVYKHPNCRVGYIAQHAFHHIENHLDKTCNEYIRWRYQTGDDREALVKVTSVLNEAELKAQSAKIEIKLWDKETETDKTVKAVIEQVYGQRQANRKKGEDEFECQISGTQARVWIGRKCLSENGWAKVIKQIDERIALRETQFARPLTIRNVEQHMADVGLEAEFSTHVKISALSTGQKVKVVLGAALWNQPHILILDEPTNYLDRESLGALAGAIREFDGGVIMISHNSQFVDTLCPVIWHLENNTLNLLGDADWMREQSKIKIDDKDKVDESECVDKFGNTVKVKAGKKKLTNKEKKARARRRANRVKNGLDPLSEDESTDEE